MTHRGDLLGRMGDGKELEEGWALVESRLVCVYQGKAVESEG